MTISFGELYRELATALPVVKEIETYKFDSGMGRAITGQPQMGQHCS